jgi:hypothetical protein
MGLAMVATLGLSACGGSTQPAAAAPLTHKTETTEETASGAGKGETDAAGTRASTRDLEYFVGRWDGDFRGTQAFSRLVVTSAGHFSFDVEAGPEPEHRCQVHGTMSIEGDVVLLTAENPPACTTWSEAKLGRQKLLRSDARSFDLGDMEFLDAIDTDERGKYRGPVWSFVRAEQ